MSQPFDVLVLAAHPDDAEIQCGGTILQLVAAGRRVAIVDLSRGEKGTYGDPTTRAEECAAATRLLGVQLRENLGLPDTELRDDARAQAAVVGVLRRLRPALLLAPLAHDLHPDHEAAGQVARRAFFTAGLKNVHPELGAPFRPELLAHFPGHLPAEPTFCVDISEFEERKHAAIACYATQFPAGQRAHFVRGLDPQQRRQAADRYWGARIGCRAAEPFVVDGPLRVRQLAVLLPDVGQ
jgi:bacillithiol biosynthesis deacetylase BshB1